jgi:hypothetical protein
VCVVGIRVLAAPPPRHDLAGHFGAFPLAGRGRLAFKNLVCREEILDLGQPVVGQVLEVEDFGSSFVCLTDPYFR